VDQSREETALTV